MRSGFFAVGFIETAHKVLKNISAVNRTYLVGTEIAFLRCKFLDDKIKRVAFNHSLDNIVKFKLCKHVLYIVGKPVQIVSKVDFDIVGIGKELFKGKL